MNIDTNVLNSVILVFLLFAFSFGVWLNIRKSKNNKEIKEVVSQILNGADVALDLIKAFNLNKLLKNEHMIDELNEIVNEGLRIIKDDVDKFDEEYIFNKAYETAIREANLIGIEIDKTREEALKKLLKIGIDMLIKK